MTMQTALQKPADSATNSPGGDAQRADRVADEVAVEGVLVLGPFTTSPRGGLAAASTSDAVQRERQRRG
jgi:hypothetical protein